MQCQQANPHALLCRMHAYAPPLNPTLPLHHKASPFSCPHVHSPPPPCAALLVAYATRHRLLPLTQVRACIARWAAAAAAMHSHYCHCCCHSASIQLPLSCQLIFLKAIFICTGGCCLLFEGLPCLLSAACATPSAPHAFPSPSLSHTPPKLAGSCTETSSPRTCS